MEAILETCLNKRVEIKLSTGTRLMGTIYSVSPSGSIFTISDSGAHYVEYVAVAHVVRLRGV